MTTARSTTQLAQAGGVLVTAFLVTGFTMRIAATSIGAVLGDLQDGLHVSGGVAGLITTLPVLCFAGIGALTPRLGRRFGAARSLVLALVVSTVGLALRPIGSNPSVFVLFSVLALSGGAVANVLMPSLVKQHFPDRIGPMTALYTTGLAIGTTAGAGLTVPIGDLGGGWRFGLGSWSILTALAVLPWLLVIAMQRRRTAADNSAGQNAGAAPGRGADVASAPSIAVGTLLRSRTAWALTIFFAAQSMQAYISFGWFARFLSDHGISDATAGAMVALYSAMSIPVSVLAPRVPVRRQRAVIAGFCGCNAAAYAGLATAPNGGAWAWMVLAGVGAGTFPMALTLIGLRSRDAPTTAALSAFVQAIGYVIAGTGPLLFGALRRHRVVGLPLTVLFVALGVTFAASWPATARRHVDDEVANR